MQSVLETPLTVPHCFTNPYTPPVRRPLHSIGPALPRNTTPFLAPCPDLDMNRPSANAWAEHVWSQPPPMTLGDTPVWPQVHTLPNNDNMVTIPADTPHWAPGTFPPMPFGTAVPLHMHPSLIPNPLNPTIPVIQWDVLHRPEQARLHTGRGVLTRVDFQQLAVYPNAPKLWIGADEDNNPQLAYWMRIWGPIMVENGGGCTILNVMDAVHEYLNRPLTRHDLERIKRSESPVNPAPFFVLGQAAIQRAADAYSIVGVSLRNFTRIDVLGGTRMWGGVRPVLFMDGTFKLFLTLFSYQVPRVTNAMIHANSIRFGSHWR